MLQNSGSSWRDRVRAKSAIVAIHLLSVISSIRLCVVGPLEGALDVLALRCHLQVAWSRVYLWIVACIHGFLLIENVRTSFLLPTFWRQLAEIATGRRARCRFADFAFCFVIAALRPSTEAARRWLRSIPHILVDRRTGL